MRVGSYTTAHLREAPPQRACGLRGRPAARSRETRSQKLLKTTGRHRKVRRPASRHRPSRVVRVPPFESLIERWDGEEVVVHFDRPTGSWMFVCIHSTVLGPAGG